MKNMHLTILSLLIFSGCGWSSSSKDIDIKEKLPSNFSQALNKVEQIQNSNPNAEIPKDFVARGRNINKVANDAKHEWN